MLLSHDQLAHQVQDQLGSWGAPAVRRQTGSAEMLIFCGLVYIPVLAGVFHHGPINLWPDWAFLLMLWPTLLIADEIRKLIVRRRMRAAGLLGNTDSESTSVSVSGAAVEEGAS
jgi:hypothetical protein